MKIIINSLLCFAFSLIFTCVQELSRPNATLPIRPIQHQLTDTYLDTYNQTRLTLQEPPNPLEQAAEKTVLNLFQQAGIALPGKVAQVSCWISYMRFHIGLGNYFGVMDYLHLGIL